ncbi:glycine--tRNA ligase subunit beta [Phenylobacterium sp.]|jgi:glycyl-tRNA synthetase beta chain|uniref:glycine--tRNA ligase subunit beta n=1 Tax=Phenylobacterium sp. TaxID=1871053 RepID=UPI002F94AAE8
MPQLLLELLSEEIPARMQAQAARDLERLAREKLAAEGLLPEALTAFAGPRRLTLVAEGLPAAQADRHEELKGPRVGAPPQALEGFLRKAGLTQDQLTEKDGVWFAHVHKAGRQTTQIVAEMVEAILRGFPWPKSMTSGVSKLRWVRPLRSILCTFDGEVVPLTVEDWTAGDATQGHRFMGAKQTLRARTYEQYAAALEKNFVVLDPEERKQRIVEAARTLCFARNLELVEDPGLLDEVAGLTEWPVPILGDMDPVFLDLPPEVIRTSMRVHQRYFAVRNPQTGKLAPHFVAVANIDAIDGGKTIARGNAKVLSARLSDARFFWTEDRNTRLEDRLEKLKGVTFHAKLGTMHERVERIVALARALTPYVMTADQVPEKVEQAARLCKADLVSGMVGEFPELQGVMGGYYAEAEGLDTEVVDAVRHHYRPQGPNDAVPVQAVGATVALADKLDTLISFFGIDEKPTGSRDPFALRRAALGVIRILIETRTRLPLKSFVSDDLLAFFADRLKVQLREEGQRHDLVDAVFALGDDDLVRIVARVKALGGFLGTDDGKNLLAGYKRAVNILRAEEKKGALPTGEPAEMPGAPAEETALVQAVGRVESAVDQALAQEDFEGAMRELAGLRGPVDAFFDKVLVNSEVAAERDNRLRLLARVRDAMGRVADFSQVTG